MERNTAKLTIEHGSKYGFIYFENGQVVHAEYDPDVGEEAISKLIALYSGAFKVESGIRPPVKSINKHWNNLLLDTLHKIDDSEDNPDRKYDHLFERLLTVRGVQNIAILQANGEVVASSSEMGPSENYLFGFTQLQASKVGETINFEAPEFVSITAAAKKYIFTRYNKLNLAIEMEQKIKLDVVLPLIKQALG
jgi:hypothetical protein